MTRTPQDHSLWLMPSGVAYRRLADRISALGHRYGTPVFEPHLTLLGGVAGARDAIVSKAKRLAKLMAPVELRLTKADYGHAYFQCVFIEVEPTRAILDVHARAKRAFAVEQGSSLFPHLSLIYGDLSVQKKQAAVAEIGGDFPTAFEADALHVYFTGGEPRGWQRISSSRFKRRRLDRASV